MKYSCLECKRSVPLSLDHPGGICPHCGALWSGESGGIYMVGNVPAGWRTKATPEQRANARRKRREHDRQEFLDIWSVRIDAIIDFVKELPTVGSWLIAPYRHAIVEDGYIDVDRKNPLFNFYWSCAETLWTPLIKRVVSPRELRFKDKILRYASWFVSSKTGYSWSQGYVGNAASDLLLTHDEVRNRLPMVKFVDNYVEPPAERAERIRLARYVRLGWKIRRVPFYFAVTMFWLQIPLVLALGVTVFLYRGIIAEFVQRASGL